MTTHDSDYRRREDRFTIAGQTAIVTGASQGIGRTIAEQFSNDGANVVLCSRDQANVDAVANAINSTAGGGEAVAVECDVRDRGSVEALVEATVDRFGALDTLINNAGASFVSPFEDLSENAWKTVVDVNLHGTYHCTQAAGEYMRQHEGGAVVNFASVAGERGSPLMTHYGAAKAGVINLTRSLAFEWSEYDIRINCISPGIVATPGVESQMNFTASSVDRDLVRRRVGLTEEVADLAQFLVSPAASYIVGENIFIRGVPQLEERHRVGEPYDWM